MPSPPSFDLPPGRPGYDPYDPEIPIPKKKVRSDRLKAAYAFKKNFRKFFEVYKRSYCGVLTLNFSDRPNSKCARNRLFKARKFLGSLFTDYISILDYTRSGTPHFHLIVSTRENIARGFSCCSSEDLDRMRVSGASDEEIQKARRFSTANPILQEIRKALHERLPDFGFGKEYPAHLEPIKCPPGLRTYLAKKIEADQSKQKLHVKGTHIISYRHKSPARCASANFGWNGRLTRTLRRKKEAIRTTLGFQEEDFSKHWGSDWHRILMTAIADLDAHHPSWEIRSSDDNRTAIEKTVARALQAYANCQRASVVSTRPGWRPLSFAP